MTTFLIVFLFLLAFLYDWFSVFLFAYGFVAELLCNSAPSRGATRVYSEYSAVSETLAAVCFGDVVRVRISATGFGAFRAEFRVAADGSRDTLFLCAASSTLITDFDTADYFDHTGATDGLGCHAVEIVAIVYDLWATDLHAVRGQLGVDHEALTYRFGGRDFRLTYVHGNVIWDILA